MKTTLYKLITILLFMPLLSFSNNEKGKYKKTKTIDKEYNVSSKALLKINNRYGNVDITSWNEDRIVFEIEITVSGNNEDKVINKLDDIDVVFNASSSQVSAKTLINKNKTRSWFSWGNNNNTNFKINYKVKMPISNDLSIYNDYGSIYLNELNGKANINCDYGKIVIGALNHVENTIHTDYSSNSIIEYINGGRITADYSKFTVEAAKNIRLTADYTTSIFENIEHLKFNCDYGSLRVDKANFVVGNGDYLSMRFGKIFKELTLEANYGSIRVANVENKFNKININSNYTGIKIGLAPQVSCNIVSKLSYAGFKTEGNFTFNKKQVKSTNKYYEGYHNNSNNNATINIHSDYGSVKIYEY